MNLRRILMLLGLAGVLVLLVSTLANPHKLLLAFSQVHWYVVPLLVAVQLTSYYCNSRYYSAFFTIFGNHVPLRHLYATALGVNFANQAIPSGGVSGTSYLAEALRGYGVPSGKATLAQIGRYSFTFLSFLIVLSCGFVMLFFSRDLNKVSVRLVIFLMTIILIIGLTLLLLFSERRRMMVILKPFVRGINAFSRRVLHREKPAVSETQLSDFLDEFYHGYKQLLAHKRSWPRLLAWTLGANIAEVTTIYVVFIGFGYIVNPGVVITGYALAIILSITSIFTSGVGVYEAGMIGTFAALGVPFAVALAVVLVYRVLNMSIFLPVGLYFYRRDLKDTSASDGVR